MKSRLRVMASLFLAGLGVVIGARMPTEAMCVAASIPMTLLVTPFVARDDKRAEPRIVG